MRKMALIVWVGCFCFVSSVFASSEGKSQTELNRKVVLSFYDMAFHQHKPAEAAQNFIGAQYIQHNPTVANGKEAFVKIFTEFFKTHPKAHAEVKRSVAEGDLVVLHVHSHSDEKDLGRAVVDIFRLDHGKIVEHWDVLQSVPEKSANANTMF